MRSVLPNGYSDVDLDAPVVGGDLIEIGAEGEGTSVRILAPLERLVIHRKLSGAHGENRASAFCYIQAKHDLDAIHSYLHPYRDQAKTLRAYTKE